ncbi:ABC transporter permease [uncultured Dysosmobacter sp.]|uniref:ABC transporter permease n=1 Tax=uncultured Dysosmobacter sp. TaxID=2591384 RepID=UPI00262A961F|nr:ABC transporter permease [uncultured Dysosmobacter sp.]
MKSFHQVYAALRRRNRKQYALLAGCCFFSVLLITAYASMMRAPTILSVLPEGGDSRKQVMMVFVLAVIGCGVFTTYASSLFFRQKSRETGVFLALGAARRQLKRELTKELALLSFGSCAAGAVLGAPLAWAVWQIFRAFVVDTQEMALAFSAQAYLLALAFSAFVIGMLFFLGGRSIRRTNIIDIVQESHKSEPIRAVPRWYGPVGIALLAAGGFLGYSAPSWFILGLHWYPPEGLTAIFYLPALVGLYMILLHTVVNGWSGKKHAYKDLISTSMMKFQGRQTVRNMLVMTLLIAGAYFASFYTPMLGTGAMMGYDARTVDYEYHCRADQDIPGEDEVRALAEDYGVTITSWAEAPMLRLGVDGWEHVEEDGPMGVTWHEEYRELMQSDLFLSESGYNALTGESLDLAPGTVAGIFDSTGDGQGRFGGHAEILTNTANGKTLSVTPTEGLRNDILFGRYVMDDGDYAAMAEGLPPDWRESTVCFDVEDCEETYDFAKALFYEIVDRSGPEVEQYDSWDPVIRAREIREEGSYFLDREHLTEHGFEIIDYEQRDSSNFRMRWQYMPQFRVLDKADFVKTTAVFLTLFIFIAIVCFAAVVVIAFTRCMTIALTNRRVYDDLRHLGAPGEYLRRSVRSQVKRVFLVPAVTGTTLIYAFYAMIMYFNDNRLTETEIAGMLVCLGVIAAASALLYGVYRLTLKKVCGALAV